MTPSDEKELHRLAEMLRMISSTLEPHSPLREAIQKAGLALSLSFIHGLRPDIERQYGQLGVPLTDSECEHLRDLGLEP